MRFPVLRTISGRILLGFAVLILTFGGVSLVTVHNMGLLSREIRVIRIGYSKLALIAKDLAGKQKDLRQYLLHDLVGESTDARVKARVGRFRKARDKLLDDSEEIFAGLSDLPAAHERRMKLIEMRLTQLRKDVRELDVLYRDLLASPPLDHVTGEALVSPEHKLALAALERLQRSEGRLHGKMFDFERDQRKFFRDTALRLEKMERRLRTYTFFLGVTAVIVGLLITLWVTWTLRPLRRLRSAAQRIARGDYASRIDERGPSEVADLAKEFNFMGSAIEERQRELVRSERLVAVGKMAAMITHEVRNPLSSIGLNTELLEEELGDLAAGDATEARALCRAINREVDRLTVITEEYLQFARLPKPKLHPEALDRMVENLATFEREQLAARGIELVIDIPAGLPQIMVDDAQLRQSLLNLVRNAADANEESGGGRVTISARSGPDRTVDVLVTDRGPGISDEIAPKLFDPFFSTKEGGTGLGLALTHQIIKEHGGSIQVDSQAGQGATFIITLPVASLAVLDPADQG